MADPRITWRLGVDDNVTRKLRGIDGQISSLGKSLRNLGGFAGFAAITAGIAQVGREAFQLAGQLQDASDKLGVSAVELQKLKGAAEAAGGSFDQIQTALVFLAKTTGDAERGSKKAAEAFRLLGIDAARLAELPLDERLSVIAAQLQKLPPGAARADLAVKVLGRGAADLLPVLGNLDDELAKVNKTLSDDQVKALDDAGDAWSAFWRDSVAVGGGFIADLLLKMKPLTREIQQYGRFIFVPRATDSRGPSNRGGQRNRFLSDDQNAAIVGAPGRRDGAEALASLKKITDEVDALLDKQQARTDEFYKSYSGDRALAGVVELQEEWNAQLQRAAEITEASLSPFDQLVEKMREIQALESQGLLSTESAAAARQIALEELARTADQSAEVVSSKTEQILEDIRGATQGFARDITDVFFDSTQSIGDMFVALAEKIARAFIEVKLIQPILDGILGGIGGTVGEIDLSTLPQRRALGGPVFAGQPYVVGESGPELFVPGAGGKIVPNGAGGGAVNVNLTVNSLDPRTAASVLVENERVISDVIRRAMVRSGRVPNL